MKRSTGTARAILFGALLAAALTLLGGTRGSLHLVQADDDPALLRELAERVISPPFPDPSGQMHPVTLLPGALPDDLPLRVPMPPGSRLIGSVVHSQPGGRQVDIVLDVPGSAADALAFAALALADQGFARPQIDRGFRPGFQPTLQPSVGIFCAGPTGPWLNVNVFPKQDGPADMRYTLNTGFPGPCGGAPPPPFPGPSVLLGRLPALYAPQGVQVPEGSVSGGPGIAATDVVALTGLAAVDLETAFEQQLTAAGWTRLDSGASGPLAWSSWALPDGSTQGFLSVTAVPGTNQRALHLQVTQPPQG